LPMGLAKVHKKHHTPHLITWMVGLTIATIAATCPSDKLLKLSNFGTMVTFTIVCIGTIYLRYKKPDLKREFECPFVPVVPMMGVVLFLGIIFSLPNEIFLYAGGWILFMLVVYFGYSRHNSHLLHPKVVLSPVKAKVSRKKK
jgi:basic amino acid/polyamine antiporter, APA family